MSERRRIGSWAVVCLLVCAAAGPVAAEFETGKPEIRSMSVLAFGPDGVLFVGDGKSGAVWALDLDDRSARGANDPINVRSIENKIAAMLGTRAADIMVHDLAVNPLSQNVYMSVSRDRGKWNSRWLLPNDIADAQILLRVKPDGSIEEVPLEEVKFARAILPNPIDAAKAHPWKQGISLRTDTVTDMVFDDGTLWVAGLSNEEFASTMWKVAWPFGADVTATTLEVFHGAHGEYETHAPIRTFVPYDFEDSTQVLAAYLCTPLATFDEAEMQAGKHVRGRTVAEFGSGNFPLDMVVYEKDGQRRLLIANNNLPLMIVRPEDIAAFEGSITEAPEGYMAGVAYEARSGQGIEQMDLLNAEQILLLQSQPGGTVNLVSHPVRRF